MNSKKQKTEEKTAPATTPENPSQDVSEKTKTVRERLKELDQMKKDEMITEKEYQTKRKEILKEL